MIDGLRTVENKLEQLDITGSIFGTTLVSGGALNLNGVSGTFARINDSNGYIKSIGVGSPITYGAKLLAGSVITSAGSVGVIVFGVVS